MKNKCLGCGGWLNVEQTTLTTYALSAFAEASRVGEVICKSCSLSHAVATNVSRPTTDKLWRSDREILTDPHDVVWPYPAAGKAINGRQDLYVSWAWMPVQDDDVLTSKLVTAIQSDVQFRRPSVTSLLVIESESFIPEVLALADDVFDAVAMLTPRVMAGAGGPCPSVRAERSIWRDWSGANLKSIRHYWPSFTLNKNDYVPLANDNSLMEAWAASARRN